MIQKIVVEKGAAEFTGFAVQTLRNWRFLGKGPPYLKIGRSVRYQLDDLDAFLSDRRIEPENDNFINNKY